MTKETFDKKDVLAIFEASGLLEDIQVLKDGCTTVDLQQNDLKLYLVDDRGIWPNLELKRILSRGEYELVTWRPAMIFNEDLDSLDVKNTPSLPFPFTAHQLAAFMLDGPGSQLADFFGDWIEGPDKDSLRDIDGNFNKAKRAVIDAYDAYRQACDNGASTVEELTRLLLAHKIPASLLPETAQTQAVDQVSVTSTLTATKPAPDAQVAPPSTTAQDVISEVLGLKKQEQQIRIIEREAAFLYSDIKNIPTGGKKKIMDACQKANRGLFGVSVHPFNASWKAALKQQRIRMKNHNIFAGGR